MINFFRNKPIISVIVVIYNMRREAKRTLFSLSSQYQQDVKESDYEVIVVENGSTEPLTEEFVKSFGSNFRYYYINNASPSPVPAINFGARKAKGKILGLMIDGARMLTPGVIKYAMLASRSFHNPIIVTLIWHLGPDVQHLSIKNGYNTEKEDELLDNIKWPSNGYRLFEISSLAQGSKDGWLYSIAESNCFFIHKRTFDLLSGYDEHFNLPGGGSANRDIYARACALPDADLVYILGEGSFHQLHGGVSTDILPSLRQNLIDRFHEQYFNLRSIKYSSPKNKIHFIGHFPGASFRFFKFKD